jgi:MFS family permease
MYYKDGNSMENSSRDSENTPTTKSANNHLWQWVIGIMLLSFGSQTFTEIEGNWLNSYMKYYTDLGSNTWVSLMVAVNTVIGTVFFLIWGVISDNTRSKWGRRLPFLMMATFGTAFILFFVQWIHSTVLLFILVGIAIPITSNGMHMTGKVIVPDLIEVDKRGRTNTLVTVAAALASMAIWIVSLVLLPEGQEIFSRDLHLTFIFVAIAVLCVTGIQALFFLREPPITTPPRPWNEEFRALLNYRQFKENRNFFVIFIGGLFVLMSQYAYMPFLLILVQEIDFTLETMLLALPIVGGSVGLMVALVSKYIDKIGRKKVVLMGTVIAPIGAIVITLWGTSSTMVIIGLAIMMPFATVVQIGTDTWTQDLLPKDARGRFMGIIRIGNALGRVPGVILAGLFADWFGILYIFLAGGLILWFSIPIFLHVPETLHIRHAEDSR